MPPNDGGTYLPSTALSTFDGQAAAGQWTLSIRDQAQTSSGTLSAWSLEVCASPVVSQADAFATLEDSILSVPAPGVLANDATAGAGPLEAELVSDASQGILVLAADGGFDYQPTMDFCGVDSFVYRAVDQSTSEFSADTTATITVQCVNDAPVAADDLYFDPDGVINIAAPGVLANDSDVEGDALTAQLVTGPADGMLVLNADGSFEYNYTGIADLSGSCQTDSFTYSANDGVALSAPATVTLNFGATCNRNPEGDAPDRTDAEGDAVLFDLDAFFSDPDMDPISYEIGPLPDGISYDAITHEVSGDLSSISAGTYSVQVTVTDDQGGSFIDTFQWTVTEALNNDPTVVGEGAPDRTDDEGDVININLADFFSDADADTLTYAAAPLPPGVALDVNTGVISGTLSDMSSGSYDVMITVTDGRGGQANDSFLWTVRDVAGNSPPVATGLPDLVTVAGSQVSYDASQGFTDPDDDPLTYSATNLPTGLSIDSNTGLITGSVTDTAVADYQATISATDGMSAEVSNPLTIRVISGGRIFADGFEGNSGGRIFADGFEGN